MKSCESCGNDCSGRLCSICRQDKQYDAPDGKSAEWEWERQKRERDKEKEAWYECRRQERQTLFDEICRERGRHQFFNGENECAVCGITKERWEQILEDQAGLTAMSEALDAWDAESEKEEP